MAEARRYQSDQRTGTPQGRDPFSYGQGIRAPAAPNIPMPPRPSAAPPGPPRIYEPRITPAQAQFEGQSKIASQLSQVLGDWGDRFYKKAAIESEQSGLQAGTLAGGSGAMELSDEDTIYANAFNKGVMEAYKGRLLLDSKQALTKYAADNPADAETFDKLVNAYTVSTEKQQSDPQIQAYTRQKIGEYAVEYRNGIVKEQAARAREQSEVIWNEALYQKELDLQMRIKDGDQAMITNTGMDIQDHLQAGIASGFVNGDQAFELSKKLREDAAVHIYMEDFKKEARDGNGDMAFLAFRNNDDLDVSAEVRKRVEQDMIAEIRQNDFIREKEDKALEETKIFSQQEVTALGLEQYGMGNLMLGWVNKQIADRTVNNTQGQMLLRLANTTLEKQKTLVNAGMELELWDEIYAGVSPSEMPGSRDKIFAAIGNGVSPSTGASMLKVLADPDYMSITKTDRYQLAVRQITTVVGKSTGDTWAMFADDNTAAAVAAAQRELYELSIRHPDQDPLDLVENIINRAMGHLNRVTDPGIRPPYTALNNDGSFNLQGSNAIAEVAWTDGKIDTFELAEIIEKQRAYHQFKTLKDKKNPQDFPSINEQDAEALRQEQEAAGRAARANQ
jgi:hypothetical protein